jgi:hypothetical protein
MDDEEQGEGPDETIGDWKGQVDLLKYPNRSKEDRGPIVESSPPGTRRGI